MESPGDEVVREGSLRRGRLSRDLKERRGRVRGRAAERALLYTGNSRVKALRLCSRTSRGPV